MNSHNHPMFGSVGAWLYQALAGITQPEGTSGFRNILIQPQMARDLRYAAGTIHTPRGMVTSAWKKSSRHISLDVTIPVNAQAKIYLPKFGWEGVMLKENGKQIYDGQKFLTGEQGIRMVEEDKNNIILKIGSGRYSFQLFGKWTPMSFQSGRYALFLAEARKEAKKNQQQEANKKIPL